MKRILIIEDDAAILEGLTESFALEQYDVRTATDGIEGFELARQGDIDLIILDLMLPGKSGESICQDLRKSNIATPIIMLTSKSDEIDRVLGLEYGADDYVTKPFSVRELLARVKAVLRRSSGEGLSDDVLHLDSIHVDFRKMELSHAGNAIHTTVRELEVLKFLVAHEGEVVTRDMLLDEVWGYDHFPTTRTVDNYILSLRKKIEEDHANPRHILTVHTAGYRFVK